MLQWPWLLGGNLLIETHLWSAYPATCEDNLPDISGSLDSMRSSPERMNEQWHSKTGCIYQGRCYFFGVANVEDAMRRTAKAFRPKLMCWAHTSKLYDVSFACGSGYECCRRPTRDRKPKALASDLPSSSLDDSIGSWTGTTCPYFSHHGRGQNTWSLWVSTIDGPFDIGIGYMTARTPASLYPVKIRLHANYRPRTPFATLHVYRYICICLQKIKIRA